MLHTSERRRGARSQALLIRSMFGAVATAAISLALAACAPRAVPPAVGVPWGATVEAIVENPSAAEGKLVTVSGEVNRVFGPRWFSIGGEEFGGPELLVVGPSSVPGILDSLADSGRVKNDIVQVTGHLRIFSEESIEKEIGTEFGSDLLDQFFGKPVVVMTDLDITPRVDNVAAAVSVPAAVPAPVPVPVPVPMPVGPITDEVIIITAPDKNPLIGRSVALFDAKVQSVAALNAFWVGKTYDRQLFVAVDSGAMRSGGIAELRPGQRIAVAGVLREVPTDPAKLRAIWNVSGVHQRMLANERLYLAANAVMVTDGRQSGPADRGRVRSDTSSRMAATGAVSSAGVMWQATLQPSAALLRETSAIVGGAKLDGRATIEPVENGRQTQVEIHLYDAVPNARNPWHVHHGSCRSEGAVLGPESAYEALAVGADGGAHAIAKLPIVPPRSGSYMVHVQKSPTDMETIIACGNLLRTSGN